MQDTELILLEGILSDLKKGFGKLSAKAQTLSTAWLLKQPKDIIDIALKKYEEDFEKAYKWLKGILTNEIDKESQPKEYTNLQNTVKAFRKAIIKASGSDPEKGKTEESEAEAQMDATDFEGQSAREIAMDYLERYKNSAHSAAKALKGTIARLQSEVTENTVKEMVAAYNELALSASKSYQRRMGGEEGDSYRDKEIARKRSFYNAAAKDIIEDLLLTHENDPKSALKYFSQKLKDDLNNGVINDSESRKKAKQVVTYLQKKIGQVKPDVPTQPAQPSQSQTAADPAELIMKDKTYNDRANLRDSILKRLNALPEDKKAAAIKAAQANPQSAISILNAATRA